MLPRARQGRNKKLFQDMTPKELRAIALDTAQEATITFAQLQEDLDLGMPLQQRQTK